MARCRRAHLGEPHATPRRGQCVLSRCPHAAPRPQPVRRRHARAAVLRTSRSAVAARATGGNRFLHHRRRRNRSVRSGLRSARPRQGAAGRASSRRAHAPGRLLCAAAVGTGRCLRRPRARPVQRLPRGTGGSVPAPGRSVDADAVEQADGGRGAASVCVEPGHGSGVHRLRARSRPRWTPGFGLLRARRAPDVLGTARHRLRAAGDGLAPGARGRTRVTARRRPSKSPARRGVHAPAVARAGCRGRAVPCRGGRPPRGPRPAGRAARSGSPCPSARSRRPR